MDIQERKKYKALIFDLYDTLVNLDMTMYSKAFDEISKKLKIKLPSLIEAWKKTSQRAIIGEITTNRQRIEETLENLNLKLEDKKVIELTKIYEKYLLKSVSLYDGVVDMLKEFKFQYGFKLGLLSNATCSVHTVMRHLDIEKYFDVAVYSYREKIRKPDPKIFLLTCKRLKVQPKEAVFIGDGAGGELEGALKAGLSAIALKHDRNKYENTKIPSAFSFKTLKLYVLK